MSFGVSPLCIPPLYRWRSLVASGKRNAHFSRDGMMSSTIQIF